MPNNSAVFQVSYSVMPGVAEEKAPSANIGCQLHISHTVRIPGSNDVHCTTIIGLGVIDSPKDIALALVVLMKKDSLAARVNSGVVDEIAKLLASIQ